MIKQFNLALKIFDDIHTQANDDIELSDGWYLVDDDMIDNISASITGGGDVWLDDSGKLTCSGKSPSPLHIWNGSQWILDEQAKERLLVQAKTEKLTEINSKAQAFVSKIAKLDETPEFEQATWQEQANEARAWANNPEIDTPKLALIAIMRGVPLNILRQKCLEKVNAFYQLSFAVAGQRQGFEDRLIAAETLEQVQAIEPVYQLPQQ
ncbi:Uncharacterised protein [Pasteurella bettyae]|nr:Uncharacterised protein [Pasteurella bettyae]